MPRRACVHCGEVRFVQGRGLCQPCHKKPEIRSQYPLRSRRHDGAQPGDPEPTLAELEALIAEQSKPENLPDWWLQYEERRLHEERAKSPPKRYKIVPARE